MSTTDTHTPTRGARWRRASARALTGIGGAYQHLGRLAAAQRLLTAALTVLAPTPATDLQRLATVNRLGVVYKTAGRYHEAQACYTQVLSVLDSLAAPPLDLLAVTHHNLAGLAYARGNYASAHSHIREALTLRHEAGAPLADRAADKGVLGAVLAAQGQEPEARALLNGVLVDMEHEYGTDHYEVAVVLQNLAALEQRRDPARAQRLYERALAIKRQRLGPHHPETGIVLNNLATLHRQQGRHQLALDLYLQARPILERGYGPNHPAARTCEQNLQRLHNQPGHKRAEPPTQRNVVRDRSTYDKEKSC